MASLKVYKGNMMDAEAEFKGMQEAATSFTVLQNSAGGPTDNKLFEEMVFDLINVRHCTVTYLDDGEELPLSATKNAGQVKVTYNKGGSTITLKLLGHRDKFNEKKINMIIPEGPVSITDPYLANIVVNIKDRGTLDEKKAYLLGNILLKKCR